MSPFGKDGYYASELVLDISTHFPLQNVPLKLLETNHHGDHNSFLTQTHSHECRFTDTPVKHLHLVKTSQVVNMLQSLSARSVEFYIYERASGRFPYKGRYNEILKSRYNEI